MKIIIETINTAISAAEIIHSDLTFPISRIEVYQQTSTDKQFLYISHTVTYTYNIHDMMWKHKLHISFIYLMKADLKWQWIKNDY